MYGVLSFLGLEVYLKDEGGCFFIVWGFCCNETSETCFSTVSAFDSDVLSKKLRDGMFLIAINRRRQIHILNDTWFEKIDTSERQEKLSVL